MQNELPAASGSEVWSTKEMSDWVEAERALSRAESSGSPADVEAAQKVWDAAQAAIEARARADGQYPPA